MKSKIIILLVILVSFACKNEKENAVSAEETPVNEVASELAYASFGEVIEADGAWDASLLAEKYESLNSGDTLITKVSASINEVCSSKGCWMKLDLGNDEEVMVKFKDYGFFMPLDATGEVIINGKAFVSETSVDELRHYAEDAGKTEEEIAAITTPKKTYGFEADGVLLKQ